MVPNQRQLSIVVSDWESYLGSLFLPPMLWDLVLVLLLLSPTRLFVLLVLVFLVIIKEYVCLLDHFIEDTTNTTALFGLESFYFVFFILSCSSFKVIGESIGFW